ncbi:MAG: hypothetical protein DMG56_12450 [Acidobacteria bacterium]|nr:MAG: hypothetical protein DMG56_12450 [Acidobacteriota bacterium]
MMRFGMMQWKIGGGSLSQFAASEVLFVTLPENFHVEQNGVSQVRAEIRTRGVVHEHKNGASAGFGILDPRVCVLATAPAAPSKANVPATPAGKSDGTASANPRGTRGAQRGEGTFGTWRTWLLGSSWGSCPRHRGSDPSTRTPPEVRQGLSSKRDASLLSQTNLQ